MVVRVGVIGKHYVSDKHPEGIPRGFFVCETNSPLDGGYLRIAERDFTPRVGRIRILKGEQAEACPLASYVTLTIPKVLDRFLMGTLGHRVSESVALDRKASDCFRSQIKTVGAVSYSGHPDRGMNLVA